MDYAKIIEELKKAWDALEGMAVRGYQARVQITVAQERILAVYNAAVLAQKAEAESTEPDGPAE